MGKSWTIRTRLTFVTLVMSFFSLAVFAMLSQIRLNAGLENSLEERIEAGLERSDRSLTLTLEKYYSLLYDLCTDEELIAMVENYNSSGGSMEGMRADIRRDYSFISSRLEGVAGLAVFTEDGSCAYYDGLAASSTGSVWMSPKMNRLQEGLELYQPVSCMRTKEGEEVCVFSIQRRLIDFENVDRNVGSVLICVKESVLQDALKGRGDEFYCLEADGQVISAPQSDMLGASISVEGTAYIGDRVYSDYQTAVIRNEKSGWNIVEFYPLIHFNESMRVQQKILILMLLETGVVLLLSVLFATRPVITSVEALLTAMQGVKDGDYSVRMQKKKGMPEELIKIADAFNAMAERTGEFFWQREKAATEQKNAEISALEAQVDPHFLYNTLDAINWKAISHEEYEISEMLGDLADILRYAIKNAGGRASLGEEMVWLRKYVHLQQEKLGRKIQVFDEITPQASSCFMHKLLMQPFVENSIKHGLTGVDRDPILIITGAVEHSRLCVRIRDNGKGLAPEEVELLNQEDYHLDDHFGVENVRKRLKLYYGEEASVRFFSRQDEYMEVELWIPVLEGDGNEDCNRGG